MIPERLRHQEPAPRPSSPTGPRRVSRGDETSGSTGSTLIASWISSKAKLLSLLRIVAAFMFMQAGTTKLFGFPGASPGGGTVELFSQMGLGASLELVGGALLLLGLFTRPVAFLLAGEMAVAYFQFHAPESFWPVANHGVAAALYCFIWLYVSAAGPGPWSFDFLLRRGHAGDRRLSNSMP